MDSFTTVAFPTTAEETPVKVAAQETGAQTQAQTIRKRRLSTGGVGTTYCVVA